MKIRINKVVYAKFIPTLNGVSFNIKNHDISVIITKPNKASENIDFTIEDNSIVFSYKPLFTGEYLVTVYADRFTDNETAVDTKLFDAVQYSWDEDASDNEEFKYIEFSGNFISPSAIDMDDYYTKSEVNDRIMLGADLQLSYVLSDYVSKRDINDYDYMTQTEVNNALVRYVTKGEIDLDNFATKDWVNSYAVTSANLPDMSKYVNQNSLQFTLSHYTTYTYINTYYAKKEDLEDYAKTSSLPDYSRFAYKTEIPAYILTKPVADTYYLAYGVYYDATYIDNNYYTKGQVNNRIQTAIIDTINENDPLFIASAAYGITEEDIENWNSGAAFDTDGVSDFIQGNVASQINTYLDDYYTASQCDNKYALKSNVYTKNEITALNFVNAEQVATQINNAINPDGTFNVDLSAYAKKTDVDTAYNKLNGSINDVKSNFNSYVTKTYLGNYYTSQQVIDYVNQATLGDVDLSNYATVTYVNTKDAEVLNSAKSDAQAKYNTLNNKFGNYYTKAEVAYYVRDYLVKDADGNYVLDTTGLATETWVGTYYQPKGNYLTSHQSLNNYYTKTQIDSNIYSKTQVDELLNSKASKDYIDGYLEDAITKVDWSAYASNDSRISDDDITKWNAIDTSAYLPLSGGTMTGDITLNNGKFIKIGNNRGWNIGTTSDGGNSSLVLYPTVSNKKFIITYNYSTESVNAADAYNNAAMIYNNYNTLAGSYFNFVAELQQNGNKVATQDWVTTQLGDIETILDNILGAEEEVQTMSLDDDIETPSADGQTTSYDGEITSTDGDITSTDGQINNE